MGIAVTVAVVLGVVVELVLVATVVAAAAATAAVAVAVIVVVCYRNINLRAMTSICTASLRSGYNITLAHAGNICYMSQSLFHSFHHIS